MKEKWTLWALVPTVRYTDRARQNVWIVVTVVLASKRTPQQLIDEHQPMLAANPHIIDLVVLPSGETPNLPNGGFDSYYQDCLPHFNEDDWREFKYQ